MARAGIINFASGKAFSSETNSGCMKAADSRKQVYKSEPWHGYTDDLNLRGQKDLVTLICVFCFCFCFVSVLFLFLFLFLQCDEWNQNS